MFQGRGRGGCGGGGDAEESIGNSDGIGSGWILFDECDAAVGGTFDVSLVGNGIIPGGIASACACGGGGAGMGWTGGFGEYFEKGGFATTVSTDESNLSSSWKDVRYVVELVGGSSVVTAG